MLTQLLNHYRNHYVNVNSLSTCHYQNYCKLFRLSSKSFSSLPFAQTALYAGLRQLALKVEPLSERDIIENRILMRANFT